MVSTDLRALIKQERQRRIGVKAGAEDATSTSGRGEDSLSLQTDLQLFQAGAIRQENLDLQHFAVGNRDVQGLHYVPNFLTHSEAAALMRAIDAAPECRWVAAGERRMQNWGGKPGSPDISEELPPFLTALVDRLVKAGVYSNAEAPQHCLVNDYRRGGGIPAHQDGPLYLDRVATLSLGGPALISFHQVQPNGSPGDLVTQVLLQEGCLFVVSGEAYTRCLHSIASDTVDVITDRCCNWEAAGLRIGAVLKRPERRLSLVFVHKLQQR